MRLLIFNKKKIFFNLQPQSPIRFFHCSLTVVPYHPLTFSTILYRSQSGLEIIRIIWYIKYKLTLPNKTERETQNANTFISFDCLWSITKALTRARALVLASKIEEGSGLHHVVGRLVLDGVKWDGARWPRWPSTRRMLVGDHRCWS